MQVQYMTPQNMQRSPRAPAGRASSHIAHGAASACGWMTDRWPGTPSASGDVRAGTGVCIASANRARSSAAAPAFHSDPPLCLMKFPSFPTSETVPTARSRQTLRLVEMQSCLLRTLRASRSALRAGAGQLSGGSRHFAAVPPFKYQPVRLRAPPSACGRTAACVLAPC